MQRYKIKFISKDNRPFAHFIFEDVFINYSKPGADFVSVRNITKKIVEVPVNLIYRFVVANKTIMYPLGSIEIDKDSIRYFYGYDAALNFFDGYFFTDIRTEELCDWYLSSRKNIVRYSPNINNSSSDVMVPIFRAETIYEQKDGIISIGDVSEREFDAFKNILNKNDATMQTLTRVFSNRKDNAKIQNAFDVVLTYEQEIQAEIERHEEELAFYGSTLPSFNGAYGFAEILSRDKNILESIQVLKDCNIRNTNRLDLYFPCNDIRGNNLKAMLSFLKQISGAECLNKLFVNTVAI